MDDVIGKINDKLKFYLDFRDKLQALIEEYEASENLKRELDRLNWKIKIFREMKK